MERASAQVPARIQHKRGRSSATKQGERNRQNGPSVITRFSEPVAVVCASPSRPSHCIVWLFASLAGPVSCFGFCENSGNAQRDPADGLGHRARPFSFHLAPSPPSPPTTLVVNSAVGSGCNGIPDFRAGLGQTGLACCRRTYTICARAAKKSLELCVSRHVGSSYSAAGASCSCHSLRAR